MAINFVFLLNRITYKLDQSDDFSLIKKHILIIIIHFLKEINTSDILINMMHHQRYEWYQS